MISRQGRTRRPIGPALAGVVALLLTVLAAVVGPRAARAAVLRGAGSAAAVQLLYQTPWVSSTLQLTLSVHSPLPSSSLALNVVLYKNLETRSGFDASLQDPAVGGLTLDTLTSTLTSLTVSRQPDGDRRVSARFPVTTSYGGSGTTLGLGCPAGQCDGVYPMQVQLIDVPLRRQLAGFTTYLVYAPDESQSNQLDVGLVLPLGTVPALSTAGTSAIAPGRLGDLNALLTTLGRNPRTPVELDLYPQMVTGLERDPSPAARAVLQRLLAVIGQRGTGQGAAHEVLDAPFAPVDPAALTAAGLGRELLAQLRRSHTVWSTVDAALGAGHRAGPHPPTAPAGSVPLFGGAYVATSALDAASLATLASAGISRLVLPAADVAANPTDGTFSGRLLVSAPPAGASGSTSTTAGGTGAPTHATPAFSAYVADAGLGRFFTDPGNDPVLAAHDVLAELGLIFFEAPNDPAQRAVVIAPRAWPASSAFDAALLGGLSGARGGTRPLVRAEPLSALFSLPLASSGSPGRAALQPGRAVPPVGLAALVRSARHDIAVLASVAPADAQRELDLEDAVLVAESGGLSARQRRIYATGAPTALQSEGAHLTLPGDAAVTLTSTRGSFPVTIVSTADTELHVVVHITSSGSVIPIGRPQLVSIVHDRQITVSIGTRTSGESTLNLELVSPIGGVVLTSKKYDVLSTAFSPVAIALSIGALLVLAFWWLRSSRSKRRARRAGAT